MIPRAVKKVLAQVITTQVAWPILLTVGLLCTIGLFAIDVADPGRADLQEKFLALGAGIAVVVLVPHYQLIGRASFGLLIGAVLLLVLVLFSTPINGSHRWFRLPGGFQLQPSEIAKIAFILAMGWYLRYRRSIRELKGLVGPFLLTLIPFSLILIEPDLGTALLFLIVLYGMLLAAGARARHLILIAVFAIISLPGFYPLLQPYQQNRIKTLIFSSPLFNDNVRDQHITRGMYQQYISKIAIATGGPTGTTDSEIIRKGLLPEAHTDFIFAVVGNTWGFAGCALVVALYIGFFAAAMEIASSSRDPYARLVVVGLGCLILGQAFINIAMTTGLGPVVGIALPFVSYGGSSLLFNMVAVGLLLNISIRRNSRTGLSEMPGEMR